MAKQKVIPRPIDEWSPAEIVDAVKEDANTSVDQIESELKDSRDELLERWPDDEESQNMKIGTSVDGQKERE